MKDHRFRVYLAGPIGGCNARQMQEWRKEVRSRWGQEFDFIDPTEQLVSGDACLSYEIVERDQRAIEGADAILANMWRESIGTAIGVVHANTKGRPVVVVDPNLIDSRILAFYADAVERSIHDGMRTLRDLLRTQHAFSVLKRGGREEGFSRKKLVGSLRAACRAAEVNDIVSPAIILPRILTAITDEGRKIKGRISTTDIRGIVLSSLEKLEQEPGFAAAVAGVRAAWIAHDEDSQRSPLAARASTAGDPPKREPKPLAVPVRSGKSHATIWGKTVKRLEDVPAPSQGILRQITCVEGIAEIRLTGMARGSKALAGRVTLQPSTTPGVIEGKIHDAGPKGDIQCFQVCVHDPSRTSEIHGRIEEALRAAKALATD